jgi:hypothetical protein
MKPLEFTIDSEPGYLFEAEHSDAIVFVPASCLTVSATGSNSVDQLAFFLSGWADKSMRFSNTQDELERVFPAMDRPIVNENDPRVKKLLQRLQQVYEISSVD